MTGVEAAAMSAVVSGTLKIVCNKLAPLLIREYSSIVGVKEDLQELHDLVKEINFFLETATGNSVGSAWLQKLKDISYAVDDVVDEFQLKAENHDFDGDSGIVSKYLCTIPKSFVFQCKAANKIKSIKKRFAAIVKQRTDYHAITNSLLGDPHVRHINMRSKEVPVLPNVDEALVVGRDKDKQKIISMLQEKDDHQKIKIVSIIGLGGSGKTTLAKMVFNDDNNIEKHFELRLWVHVSQEFDVKDLVRKLFEAFSDNNPGPHELPYMTKIISEKLMGKRFLLVLDDVWTNSRDEWEEFMVYIKGGAPKSRILLTTRNREVAVVVGSADQFHLPFLSPDESWQLFQQRLVTPATGWNFEFEQVGKAIVDKCGGVPLAIKALAGALHGKDRIEEWQAMRNKNLSNSNGNGNNEDTIAACLRLSYFHLPPNLKQCFTICSLFPKGHKIDKEQLIDLWIAHDMITQEDSVDCLDLGYVGHKLFTSLLQVSFLQNVEENLGRVTCGMHDLVHDLAVSILGDEISHDMPNEATSATKSYRYFSLMKCPENLAPKDIFRKARAVYMHQYGDYAYGMALKNAKHLRSVRVGYIDAKEANTISQVKYLKYLAMSLGSCEMLPEAISDVWRLQALHVTNSYSLLELPKSIGKLKKLRTLNLSGCGELKSLPEFIGDCQMISSIGLSWCRKLTLLPDSIGRNGKLRFLRLSYTKIERLPSTITTLGNLECLELQGCYKLVELPEGMGKLEKLQVLNLKDCEKLGGMPIGIGLLSRLQKLGLFVVCKGEKFGGISELGNISTVGEELRIKGTSYVMDPVDAYKACLKQKTNLQRLELWSGLPQMRNDAEEENAELEQAVLDGLEPPPRIKELEIDGYLGTKYAKWMLTTEVGGGVLGLARFPFLKVMRLSKFPKLQHLNGLVELPCLEELTLEYMPSLESISGGPFPSLVQLKMNGLPSLEEVWMLGEKVIPEGEEGGDCNNCVPGLGQVQVGDCVTDLDITDSPKLKAKLHLPSSLQRWYLYWCSGHLLQSPGQHEGSCSSSSFNRLKKLELYEMRGLGCGGGWELLQHMTALESLNIECSYDLAELPQSLVSLTSLRSLQVSSCCICMLPEWIGELQSLQELTIRSCNRLGSLPESMGEFQSLQELTIRSCNRLGSLPESMGHLTSLQELLIEKCDALEQLPNCLGELCSLRSLKIYGLPLLTCLPRSISDLVSLEELEIWGCPGLASLPEGMNSLVSLRKLWITGCLRLTSLPQGMKGLVSLQKLRIWNCPGIKSLPEDIRGLTALKELEIHGCLDLERRCERGKGEDWHLISHIPHLYI